jgi:hypothetical protein
MLERPQTKNKAIAAHSPLPIRRVDAIPVALPLTAPMKMSGVTIATAENLLVRIEGADGRVGWGEAASAPTMTATRWAGWSRRCATTSPPCWSGRTCTLPSCRRCGA